MIRHHLTHRAAPRNIQTLNLQTRLHSLHGMAVMLDTMVDLEATVGVAMVGDLPAADAAVAGMRRRGCGGVCGDTAGLWRRMRLQRGCGCSGDATADAGMRWHLRWGCGGGCGGRCGCGGDAEADAAADVAVAEMRRHLRGSDGRCRDASADAEVAADAAAAGMR